MIGEIKCPKCGSNQIHSDKRGFKTGRAVAGTLIAGPLAGVATGAAGKNKIIITCLSCGNQFKPGEGNSNGKSAINNSARIEKQNKDFHQSGDNYKCRSCGKVSYLDTVNKKCPSCGGYIREIDACSKQDIREMTDKKIDRRNKNNNSASIIIVIAIIALFIVILATCS